ncbi:MAG: twin-arginine translocase subunit TatC, partial [Acidimicrobiaceae bacterium]
LMILAFGVGFLSPLLIVFLQLVGVLTPKTLIKQWRIAIVVIFFVAAIITPSGDPITLMALGLPLTVLSFVAILIGFVATRKRMRNSA